jgi:predicted short-subunit dehydrogenase-like oxidoreductase (DUF2520 family)
MAISEVTIIGLGALGTALSDAFAAHDLAIKSVFNRSPKQAQKVAGRHNISIFSDFPSSPQQLAPLVFITVSDTAIPAIVEQIMAWKGDLSEITFVHCSGNESAAILNPLRQQGARVASMHPLQTFTVQSTPADFNDIYFSLQGDQEVFVDLKNISNKLGGKTLKVSSEQKSNLHAAAVFASNYLITLLQAATETASTSGLSEQNVKEALLPLVQTTLNNAEGQALPEALSGPIKRGDVKTIKDHLALLNNQPELQSLYVNLGKKTVALAQSSGSIDEETAAELGKVLR